MKGDITKKTRLKKKYNMEDVNKSRAEEFEKIREDRESESICDCCGSKMRKEKRKKKNQYSKRNSFYICETCGHTFRERTTNEILRDLGLKF